MVQQIRELLHAIPFLPFKIRTADGKEYLIPSVDHALAAPNTPGVVVGTEEGVYALLSGQHIVAVEAANLLN
jgi:hypothetical protein